MAKPAEARHSVPISAIAAFERSTKLSVSIHDINGLLGAYISPERIGHHNPLCNAVKASHERTCIQFESPCLQEDLRKFPQGRAKICHGGLVEWFVPFVRSGRVEWVLFAGQRTAGKNLREPTLQIAREKIPFARGVLPRLVDDEESAHIMELLRQLNARLQNWRCDLERSGGAIDAPGMNAGRFSDPNARAHLIRRFIELRHRNPVGLADLASVLHLSKSRTSHAVRQACGKNFAQLLIDARLETAAQLLRHSTVTVLEAALRSGFNDVSNFHYVFRRKYKTTPHQFRLRHQRRLQV